MNIRRHFLLTVPKKVFSQGELFNVAINISEIKVPLVKAVIKFVGIEKVEFTIMSVLGKKFNPIFHFIFPSKHIFESTELFCQTYSLDSLTSGFSEETVKFEIPGNAVPSYYGSNGKVTYEVMLELDFQDDSRKIKTQQILVDATYQRSLMVEEIIIQNGKIDVQYESPFIIGTENSIKISTQNLTMFSPLRFVIKGTETVKASKIVMDNEMCTLPIGQVNFDEDLQNIPLKFQIPSEFQHSSEGLISRFEYFFEVYSLKTKKRLGIVREELELLSQLPIHLEYPVI